jgi:predicted ATPase/serine/threonine protein kinase/class 3 adenylate cyclase/GAF domain-containing protein
MVQERFSKNDDEDTNIMLTITNYQITKQIYESANSLVYRALRDEDNQAVILKVLKEDYPSPEELTRYRQEYDITRRLANLEGVVKAYRLEKHQNTLVICLEDFCGESLKMWRDEQRTFTLNELLTFAIRATEILGQIHGKNIIHKDINPSNIILNPSSGVLKIIDFGISTQFSKQHLVLKNPNVLEGTLAYMSPEQTGRMNRALDYHTDFYSLGATFYELFTGKLPFESTDAMELVHCHIAKQPTPPHQINPKLPSAISNIILKLLEKTAEERYKSAWGIKADLEKLQENLPGFKDLAGLSFELAQHDISDRFQIPQKLYGRKHEIDTLLAAFERVADGKAEIMLVAGYSGIGKSVLVKEIYKSLTEKQGYFISGKFDQFQRNIPYSAIVNAFKELVQQLLTETEVQLAQWKEKLLTALGSNGQVIIEVLPEIELIISKQPPLPQLGPTESQNRFNLVFQNFIRVLCQPEHPLVIFLDDLQWVDSATLKLLELVTTDRDNTALFLIGAYRDNEVEPTHPLMTTLDKLREENIAINQITLKPLAFEHINQLIADSLHHNLKAVGSLTDLVMRKTGGNPFFINQFLHTLYEEDLLHFVPPTLEQKGHWQWDIKQIKSFNITDNVVELMIGKLKKLPESTQQVLRLAACIGNRFDLNTLSVIYEKSATDTFQYLKPVLTEGLILPKSEQEMSSSDIHNSQFIIHHLHFLHDRVQQAAYALIDDEQKQTIHLQIGRLLLKNTPADALKEKVFDIVGHFNHSIELLNNQAERLKIAQLNLMAGQKAKASTAYAAASQYLMVGLELLSASSWQNQYDLTLALYELAAEVAYLSGDFERFAQLAEIVLAQTRSLLDKVKTYEIQIQVHLAQGLQLKAIEMALPILRQFGTDFPSQPSEKDIEAYIIKAQLAWKGKPIESLCDLPHMIDKNKQAAMKILSVISNPSFEIASEFLPLIVCEGIYLSIKYGNLPESAYLYGMYGIIQIDMDEIDTAYQFGQLAFSVMEKFKAKEFKANIIDIFGACISHWKVSLRETVKLSQEGYQSGLEVGNFAAGSNCAFIYCAYSFASGRELVTLERKMANYSEAFRQLNQEISLNYNEIMRQGTLNLLGQAENPCRLIGEAYNEEQKWLLLEQNNDTVAFYALYSLKILLAFWFQEYQKVIDYFTVAEEPYLIPFVSLASTPVSYTYDSLARLAVYSDCSEEEQQKHLDKVQANQEKIQSRASHAPMNFQHKFDLVEAERARVLGQEWQAAKLYDKAIAGAKENQFLHEEALAYELAAEFYLAQGMERFAQIYLKDAHYTYQQWGALAKVKNLETRYPQFLAPKTASAISTDATILATRMASTSAKGGSEWLDLNSIMKAAQTLSGEIVLSRLLEKMMHIVIENAGAEKGFLLLPKQESWFIEAKGSVDSDEVAVLQSLAIETSEQVPKKIIHYVARVQENVILHDATREGRFTREPYVVKQRPKSILCAPLINQGQLTGILYLENNLTTGAFTPERIEVLNLLSSQIGISIENARLYTSITRFLPSEFLSLLDKKNIIDVQLGDQVEKKMSILFADIRDFTSLSEKMTPQENFDFINAYLSRMEPIIAQHQGFIDKYIGDAIMALFPSRADEAVSASIAMLKKLAAYNQERKESGLKAIAIGIGLNTGLLMLGTVGGENRMDGTVISDAVNLASRIEGMTKMYGTALLISEETYSHLSDVSQYAIRTIDRVKVKGKSEPVNVYEVFDGDAPHFFDLKMKTLNDFENGLILYLQKAFTEAILCFEQVLCTHPDDKVAQIYLNRCQHWQNVGVPDDWEGVEALDSK